MLQGKMATEAIPSRVFALYKMVPKSGTISKSELQSKFNPAGGGSSYFSAPFQTASNELGLLLNNDNYVSRNPEFSDLSSMDDMRKITIQKLAVYNDESFNKICRAVVERNELMYSDVITRNDFLNYVYQKSSCQVDETMMRAWRFWAQFIGLGYYMSISNSMMFSPNAYVYIKTVLGLMNLQKGQEIPVGDLINEFISLGDTLCVSLHMSDRKLNMALSNGLRQLHAYKEIELKYINDQTNNWNLYPSEEFNNNKVTSIVFRGLK